MKSLGGGIGRLAIFCPLLNPIFLCAFVRRLFGNYLLGVILLYWSPF